MSCFAVAPVGGQLTDRPGFYRCNLSTPASQFPTEELRRQLTQLRDDLDSLARGSSTIKAELWHKATNAETEGIVGLPKRQRMFAYFGGAGNRDGYVRRNVDGTFRYASEPILDLDGKPIVDESGRPLDFVYPALRQIMLDGERQQVNQLRALAERGGSIARRIPTAIHEHLIDWGFSAEQDCWWALLFEFAWSGVNPLVRAERMIWIDDGMGTVPHDVTQLSMIRELSTGFEAKIPERWIKRLPDAYCSTLDDVMFASRELVALLQTTIATKAVVGSPSINDDAYLGSAELAVAFGLDEELVRKRLERKRKQLDFIENTNRKPREPQYLYRVHSVRPILEAMKTKS